MSLTLFDPSEVHTVKLWSCGGGLQSTAIAGLIYLGLLPKPDYAVMVDTGRERSSTWEYVDSTLRPKLAEVGVTLEIASKEKYSTVDYLGGEDGKSVLLPVWSDQSGTLGKLPTWCSGEWKKRVLDRFMRHIHRTRGYVTLLGMSTDEMKRVRVVDRETGARNEYPLVFGPRPMSRIQCLDFVLNTLGWPKPPKSTCWCCPNQSDDQWIEMRDFYPADWALAIALDYQMRETDPHCFLHHSGVPLDKAILVPSALGADPDGCDSGYYFN